MTVTNPQRMIHKVTRIVALYDWYAPLLTERQREILELHYFDDWSLGEIAEQLNISRQGVHDNLKRAQEQLRQLEAGLQLVTQHEVVLQELKAVHHEWKLAEAHVPEDCRQRMRQALARLSEALESTERGDIDA